MIPAGLHYTRAAPATGSGVHLLPSRLRAGVEALSGMDMGDVRVHYRSPQPARLAAHAFARGNDIHLAEGQERHLPHEAWHVVQQRTGRVRPTLSLGGVALNDDARLERDADVMGARALQTTQRMPLQARAAPSASHAFGGVVQCVNPKFPVKKGAGTPKAAKKPTKKKATKGSSAAKNALKILRLPAHGTRELDKQTRIIAEAVKYLLGEKGVAINLDKVKLIRAHDSGKRIVRLMGMKAKDLSGKKGAEAVDRIYRVVWDAMDEFVRTSFVRNVITYIAPGDLSSSDAKVLENAIRTVSAFRMPTRMSGFNLNDGTTIAGLTTMQHPTSPGTGMWLTSTAGHGGAHNHLDSARITYIQSKVLELFDQDVTTGKYSLKPGVTLQQIINTMIIAGGTFTFRYFTLPAMASNLTTDASVTDADKQKQTRVREYMKDQLEAFGAVRSTKKRSATTGIGGTKKSALNVPMLDLDLMKREAAPELLNPGEISPRRTAQPVSYADISDDLEL